jgi:hypothetical protein
MDPARQPLDLQVHSRTFSNAMPTAFAEQATSHLGSRLVRPPPTRHTRTVHTGLQRRHQAASSRPVAPRQAVELGNDKLLDEDVEVNAKVLTWTVARHSCSCSDLRRSISLLHM